MTMPVNADVDPATRDALSGLALGDLEVLGEALELRDALQENSGLDARAFSLVKIAALVAVDAPPASYLWQVSNALDAGASPAEILGVLRAVAPQVGGPRVVAAAPEIMVALGLSLPDGPGRLTWLRPAKGGRYVQAEASAAARGCGRRRRVHGRQEGGPGTRRIDPRRRLTRTTGSATSNSSRLPQQAAPPAAPAAAPDTPISEQLKQLTGLHEDGSLSDEEFAAAKKKLLGI